jgi:DNA-directed RNA polymerase sigma subunit (sigma70/sigma32)
MAEKITGCENDCSLAEDLAHEAYLILREKDQELISNLVKDKNEMFYIARVMIFQYQSSNSQFSKKYRPNVYVSAPDFSEYTDSIQQEEEEADDLTALKNIFSLSGYEQKLLYEYHFGKRKNGKPHTLRSLGKESKVHYTTLCRDLKKAHQKLRRWAEQERAED